MIEAVFISDLHLHPQNVNITKKFEVFLKWAVKNTQKLYILGDFFHVWPGDDALDTWSLDISKQLKKASEQISIFFLPGNRDFLVGSVFASFSNMTLLSEPVVLDYVEKIVLVHGDRYCVNDKGHQRLRAITQHKWFAPFFLKLPLSLRLKIVNGFRQYSYTNQIKKRKSEETMAIVEDVMIEHLKSLEANTLIHGHTHQPGLKTISTSSSVYFQYTLSDWDENPRLLCYNSSKGLWFIDFNAEDYSYA